MKNLGVLIPAILFSSIVHGSELVYTPTNPSFGGNPLNGTYLLNSASAQNDLKDPDLEDDDTALDDFNDSLLRSILSRITTNAANSLIGENGEFIPGVFDTGGYTIEITPVDNSEVRITTTDNTTGESTTFIVQQPSS